MEFWVYEWSFGQKRSFLYKMKDLWVEQSKNPYIIQYNLYTKSEASNLPSGAVEQDHRTFISSLKTYYYDKVAKEQVKGVTHRLSLIGFKIKFN